MVNSAAVEHGYANTLSLILHSLNQQIFTKGRLLDSEDETIQIQHWGTWLAQLEEHVTFNLGIVRSSPMLGTEIIKWMDGWINKKHGL